MASEKQWKPRISAKEEAIALIEQRFEAPLNNLSTTDPTVKIQKTAQLFTVAPRAGRPIEVGILVALYHNPALAAKVLDIHNGMVTVQRGRKEPITVEMARVKALIPVSVI